MNALALLLLLARPDTVTVTAGADQPALAARGASRIERRTAHVGLRSITLPVRVLPPTAPRRPNLCLNRARKGFPRPSTNSAERSYGDCVWAAIDGVPWEGEYEWSSDYTIAETPWYRVDFGRAVTLGEVRVRLRRGYSLRDFDVRVLDAAGRWRSLARVRGSTATDRRLTFPAVRATALQVDALSGPSHQPTIRRILELEAYAPRSAPPRAPRSFAYRLTAPARGPVYVEVREAYGEGETLREVDYQVRVNGRVAFRRRHECDGPGATSYAFPVRARPGERLQVQFVDTSGAGVPIARVRLIGDPVGQARRRDLLEPMVVAPRIDVGSPGAEEALRAWTAAMEPARAFVTPGLLAIVGYAPVDPAQVEARIKAYADLAARLRVPWVLQLSSWWADTPLTVPDGLGGRFGDVAYQQVGFSRLDAYDDPGLREMMEAAAPGSYDVRYGLTVPNLWSNTPWLTMNNRRLNAFRVERLRLAMRTVNAVRAAPGGELLQAIVTDDEPIYWPRITDWMADGYAKVNGGVPRADLLLDFNPAVVRDAAADGLRLDPRDGMDARERLWMHRNNARYVAMVCRAIHEGLSERPRPPGRPDLRERIYNYILAQPVQPLDDYGHPGFELGVVPHAALGLEAGDERYFTRARDLGWLANSDFECANPSAETVDTWGPHFHAWHDTGCRFVQLCNPGDAVNWRGLFRRMAAWERDPRTVQRALSLLVQEAAAAERRTWRP